MVLIKLIPLYQFNDLLQAVPHVEAFFPGNWLFLERLLKASFEALAAYEKDVLSEIVTPTLDIGKCVSI